MIKNANNLICIFMNFNENTKILGKYTDNNNKGAYSNNLHIYEMINEIR